MNATFEMPRVGWPGTGGLPAVLRRRTSWATVWRFVWAGPLIGGAPYVVFIVPIPFAYAIGAGPALAAGLLFACWYHASPVAPTWPWRAAVGAFSGTAGAAVMLLVEIQGVGPVEWFWPAVLALHGVPAATVLALLQRPPR